MDDGIGNAATSTGNYRLAHQICFQVNDAEALEVSGQIAGSHHKYIT